jgi:pimeloyl-ACP methyl ester carboxylesterase
MPRLADLVADLVADLGYESADVLGLSWGGALAEEFAHRHPRSCRRIVLCATGMGMIGVPPKPSALLTAAGPLSFFGARDIRQTGARIYGGGFGDDPAVAGRLAAALRAPDPVGYLWQTLAWMGWTSAHYLPTLRQPALVVAGDEDPLIPTVNARMIALLLRRGRLHIVPGGGHLALLTHADDVVPLIHDFLTESEARGPRSSSAH